MKTLAIPVSVFRVECEIASGRPFAVVERTILRSITAGNGEFERLVADLNLHPRMVAECLTALFEAGIVEFGEGSGALSVTAIGTKALADPEFIPSTLQCMRKPFRIVERVTGLADVSSNVTFERTDELRDQDVTILPPSDIDPTPGRSTVRQLIERQLRAGEWLRSVGRPEPVFRYNSSVQVDLRDGRLERLRSVEWVRALTLALGERGFDLAEPAKSVEPIHPWIGVAPSNVRSVWGAARHAAILEEALERCSAYVFVHSAFLTGSRAGQLTEPIARAVRRGADVSIARGGTEEASGADEEGVAVFRKLAYDERAAKGRFFFEPYPTGSHATSNTRWRGDMRRVIQLVERAA